MKILLIEDDKILQELYKRQFVQAGLTIDIYGTGKEGLVAAGQQQYDLVLLDILLPDIDGLDVFRQMKLKDTTKDIPVVFLTNLSQEETIQKAFDLGAKGYLVKSSYTPDQVVTEVKKFLQ